MGDLNPDFLSQQNICKGCRAIRDITLCDFLAQKVNPLFGPRRHHTAVARTTVRVSQRPFEDV